MFFEISKNESFIIKFLKTYIFKKFIILALEICDERSLENEVSENESFIKVFGTYTVL